MSKANKSLAASTIIYGLAILLAILHQDFWLWDNQSLVFGFLPIGLAYHVVFSILASAVWALAVLFAWPSHIEAFAEEDIPSTGEDASP